MRHYFDYLEKTIRENWNAPAVSDYGGTINYTYGQLAQKVEWLGTLFDQIGLQPGDKVGICGRNCSHWGIVYMAIAARRLVAVSLLPDYTSESIYELVHHSDTKVLFIGPWVRGRVDLSKMPDVDTFIALADLSIMQSKQEIDLTEVDKAMAEKYPNGYSKEDVVFPKDNMDDLALINYTSGSTGNPKGVMVTHRNLSSNVVFGQDRIPNDPSKSIVSMLPMAHMFGLMFEFLYQLAGGTHVYFIVKNLTPSILMQAFKEVHPYMILTVPLLVEKIFKKQIFPAIQKPLVKALWYTPLVNIPIRKKVYKQLMNAFGGKLEILIIGGAALNEDVERCLRQIKFPYTVGYGMTECAPLVCYEHWSKYAFRSCGKGIDRLEIKVDSPDPRRVEGELLVRGENVMRGYYKNLQATDDVFTEDGWLRTGDMGIIDKKGNVYLKGRCKNMILGSSGQNIYPEEIEDKVNSMDGVVESIVVERQGKLVALIYPEEGKDKAAVQELMKANIAAVNKQLPSYSQIASFELREQEFEKTPKKSIKRFLYK
jgi:long-chain acyl-CoA synthetase